MTKPADLHANVERVATVSGLPIICHGGAPPADASAGYSIGCIWIDTTNGVVYINEGSATSSDFDAISTV